VDDDPRIPPVPPEPEDDAPSSSGGPDARAGRSLRVEAVRRAVDQALTATAGAPRSTRARAQELADELGSVVTRVRGALEDLTGAGTTQAGALADEVQQAVGRLGRSLDDVRPATGDDLRRVNERLEALERRLDRLERDGAGPPVDA
jgi:polyhydroxyalkanoate synthesis regulator phasin